MNAPTLRLAYFGIPAVNAALANPPTLRLACVASAGGKRMVSTLQQDSPTYPAVLVSYVYRAKFLELRSTLRIRDWVLDSGAFTAHASGKPIKLDEYIEDTKRMLATDPTLVEVFALDVIGDWKASLANTKKMWKAGVQAVPCFHMGEPWDVLKRLAEQYPKVAIGGTVGKPHPTRMRFFEQVFARVWPKKLHGFGVCDEKSLQLVPWHSTDASTWELTPTAFGRWQSFGGAALSIRGSNQDLRAEVAHYMGIEARARARWARTWQEFEGRKGR